MGLAACLSHAFDETLAIAHGVHGAGGGDARVAGEPAHEELADLAGAPMRFLALAGDDEAFDRVRELVGITDGTAGAVGGGDRTDLPVALEQLVAGLSRDAERPADVGHRLAPKQAGDEAQAFIHDGAFLPRH